MAYRAAGLNLPRVTGDQVRAGTPVASLADARPGDLIFIPGSGGSMTNPGHVGLYLGSGLLVQAPHTGDVVKISPVWGASQIAAIRRIVPERERMTSDCVVHPPARYWTPRSSSPSVMPVATKKTSPLTRSGICSTRSRS